MCNEAKLATVEQAKLKKSQVSASVELVAMGSTREALNRPMLCTAKGLELSASKWWWMGDASKSTMEAAMRAEEV